MKRCFEAGAKEVFVFDHTCDNWVNSYSRSGIKAAVEAEGGTMVSGAVEEDYREIDVPNALRMKKPKVHRLILDCDVFFNVPVLKTPWRGEADLRDEKFHGTCVGSSFHAREQSPAVHRRDASLIRRPDLTWSTLSGS